MKITRRNLRHLILEEVKVLFEQEEDMFGGEEEEESGEEEGGEEAEEEGEEEGEEEEGGDEEGGEEEGGEEAEAEPVDLELEPGEEAEFTKTIDDEINAVLVGFESDALKSAQVHGDPLVATDIVVQPESKRWYRKPLAKVLYEQEEEANVPLLDVEKFTAEVSRLVMNYENLLDMETHIVNKAKLFLLTKYDEATAEKFEQILDQTYGVSLDADGGEADVPAPVALGSGFASAPGGA